MELIYRTMMLLNDNLMERDKYLLFWERYLDCFYLLNLS